MSIRKELQKTLLSDLANIALEYDEPCDRIADIKEHCSAGQYIHANPINTKQGLNCRNYCTRGRKIEKFWKSLPTMIGTRGLWCIGDLEPIDFYGVDTKGNEFPNIPNINALTAGTDFSEWTIVYDLSNINDCSSGLPWGGLSWDVQLLIDTHFRLGTSVEDKYSAVIDSNGIDWVLDRVTFSRPENYILVVQSISSIEDIVMRD